MKYICKTNLMRVPPQDNDPRFLKCKYTQGPGKFKIASNCTIHELYAELREKEEEKSHSKSIMNSYPFYDEGVLICFQGPRRGEVTDLPPLCKMFRAPIK